MNITPDVKKKWLRWSIALTIVSVLVFLGVKNIDTLRSIISWCFDLALPLVIGIAIAVIVDVPMNFFENILWKKSNSKTLCKLRRPIAFTLSTVIIIGCIVGIVMVIIPELVASVKIIAAGAISLINRFDAMTPEEYAALPFGSFLMSVDWDKMLTTIQGWLKDQSGAIVKGAFSTLSSVVVALFDFIVAFVFAIFILLSKDQLKRQAKRMIHVWIPKETGEWLIHAGRVLHTNFSNFISGQTLEAVIIGVLCMLGMLIFKIPYAPMVSVLVGITALIPVVGAFIGGGISAFMILTVDPSKAWFFIVFLVILQQLEGNLIYPKVMGKKVNLPGIWILASVTIGGGIAGPIGMLLSVPLTSTSYTLIKEATLKREQKNLSAEAVESESHPESDDLTELDDVIDEIDKELTKEIHTSKKNDTEKTRKKQKSGKEKQNKTVN